MATGRIIDKNEIRRILIIKISALGDIVRALPSLSYIARSFPRAAISFMIAREYINLIEPCPYLHEIIPYKKRKNTQDLFGFIKFTAEIRAKRFDMVLNLQNTKRFDIISLFSGAPYRTEIVKLDRPVDGVDGIFQILKTLGLNPRRRRYEFWFTDEDHEFAERFYARNEMPLDTPIVGICPASDWESKQWPLEKYAALADLVTDTYDTKVVVFGSKQERNRAVKIAEIADNKVIIASGETTIRQAARLIKNCRVFVSNDSGLMHLAAHMGAPTIGIFGSTNPAVHGPVREGNSTVYRGADCSPCYSAKCVLDWERYFCLSAIPAEQVFKTIRQVIH